MAFILNPTRKFTVKYNDEITKESFEADFEFILTEDTFTDDMQKKIKQLEVILDTDTEEVKQSKLYKAQGIIWHKIRKSLKAVRGIKDEQGNDIVIGDDEEIQKAVFEFITNFGDVAVQVLTAYMGLSSKNLKAGATK